MLQKITGIRSTIVQIDGTVNVRGNDVDKFFAEGVWKKVTEFYVPAEKKQTQEIIEHMGELAGRYHDILHCEPPKELIHLRAKELEFCACKFLEIGMKLWGGKFATDYLRNYTNKIKFYRNLISKNVMFQK